MPSFTATASGKIILFGEHAVVYGEPAIAMPVQAFQARAVVTPEINIPPGTVLIDAPDISVSSDLNDLPDQNPLRAAIQQAAGNMNLARLPACRILITSTIPQASGLGSSAAISTALIRALAAFLGRRMTDDELSQAAFEVEKIHHGTPSGIDNSVVVYQQPVYYQKGLPMEFLSILNPISILIIASGSAGDTRQAVANVREGWLQEPEQFDQIFSEIGKITRQARELITQGNHESLGPLMDRNHTYLQDLGVSTPEIDHLAQIARNAGALGAKLSGGGLGGHLIALVNGEADSIQERLLEEGAESVILTSVGNPPPPTN
jgi:mevalonate kinase